MTATASNSDRDPSSRNSKVPSWEAWVGYASHRATSAFALRPPRDVAGAAMISSASGCISAYHVQPLTYGLEPCRSRCAGSQRRVRPCCLRLPRARPASAAPKSAKHPCARARASRTVHRVRSAWRPLLSTWGARSQSLYASKANSIQAIGRLDLLPESVVAAIRAAETATAQHDCCRLRRARRDRRGPRAWTLFPGVAGRRGRGKHVMPSLRSRK